jgi:hypothetical protein
MDRQQFFHGFQFDYDLVLHDKIDFVTTVQLQALVLDGQVNLPLKSQFPQAKLVAQALLVSRFQKARAQVTMDLKRRAENRTRARVPRFFFVFSGLYMNRMDGITHPFISAQNQ